MKTLLLNFMFFVGSALVLVQCAKLFPTNAKAPARHLSGAVKKFNVTSKKRDAAIIISNNNLNKASVLKNPPAFKYSFLPYEMMLRVNGSNEAYHPYSFLKHYNFASNANNKWQADKQ